MENPIDRSVRRKIDILEWLAGDEADLVVHLVMASKKGEAVVEDLRKTIVDRLEQMTQVVRNLDTSCYDPKTVQVKDHHTYPGSDY